MSIVEFDGPQSRFPDASETGESTKCPWVEAVGLFARIKRPPRPVELNSRNLRSRGKIEDCEQSM